MVMAKTDITKPTLPPRPLPAPLPGAPDAHHCIPPKPPSEFDQKDANGDGKLNADEFAKGENRWDKLTDPDKFDRYDADNDGYVTKEENFKGQIGDALRKSGLGLPGQKEPGKLLGAIKDKFDPAPELPPSNDGSRPSIKAGEDY